MIHHPRRDDEFRNSVTRGDDRGALPLARYLPYVLERTESPTRVEYFRRIDGVGIAPNSSIHVRGQSSSGKGATVTYSLETRDLPQPIFSEISQILNVAETTLRDPHEVAKDLYERTADLGVNLWRIVELSPLLTIRDTAEDLRPIVPSVDEYLRDPDSIGKRFSATRSVKGKLLTVAAQLDIQRNLVDVRVGNGDAGSRTDEHYVIPGELTPNAIWDSGDIESDLRAVALTTLNRFNEQGLKAFREYMVAKVQKHFTSDHSEEPQTLSYTKRFPWNSSVSVKVRPGRAVVTVSSGSLDREALKSSKATAYRWSISARDSYNKTPAAEVLGQVLPVLGRLQAGLPIEDAINRLNVIARGRQGIIARASVKSILGKDVVEAIRQVDGVRVTRIPEESLMRADRLADILRGIDILKVSTARPQGIQDRPQVIREMEIKVIKQPEGEPALHLVAWNQIKNQIHAVLSPETVLRNGGLKETMVELCEAMREQAEIDYPWQGRMGFLKLLRELKALDWENSSITQIGDGKLPRFEDIHSHRMLDQVAAPVISMFSQHFDLGYGSESYVTSPAERELKVVLGEPDQDYALSLHFQAQGSHFEDPVLTRVSVASQVPLPNGERIVRWKDAHSFMVEVHNAADRGQPVLKQVVEHFATLVSAPNDNSSDRFEESTLRRLLEQLSAKLPPNP